MTTSVAKPSSYLFKNGQIYYFRVSIPHDLRDNFGKTEIRYSLRTGYLRKARVSSRGLASKVHNLITELRKGVGPMSELTAEQIREIVDTWVKQQLEEDELERALASKPMTEEEWEVQEKSHFHLSIDAMKQLSINNHRSAEDWADQLLNERGIKLSHDSVPFKVLCREMLKGAVILEDTFLERMHSWYPASADPVSVSSSLLSTTVTNGLTLSEAIDKFADEKTRSGEWSRSSVKDMTPDLRIFLELTGDIDTSFITKDHVRHFREIVMKLPKRHRLKKCYRDLSLKEIVSLDIPQDELQSPNTINNRQIKLGGFLAWLNDMDYNNVSGLNSPLKTLKPKNRKLSDKIPFTTEDLQKLFTGKGYGDDSLKEPYQFWIPLLGLFTGARLEELCQLHVSDVKVVDGVWVIDINNHGEKHVKTLAGIRQAPLHAVITEELKFPAFLAKVKAEGNTRLFPELKMVKRTEKYSDRASKWFNRRIEEVGIKDTPEGKKVFHSFRGTFTNHCKQHDIDFMKVKQIVGHSSGNDITEQHYNQAYSMSKLYEDVISKIDWGIDFSSLANSEFVPKD